MLCAIYSRYSSASQDAASTMRQLSDCRKYAAGKMGSLAAARELLDHADERTTADHYYFEPTTKKPAR